MSAGTRKLSLRSLLRNAPAVAWALLIMIAFFAREEPRFFTISNATNLLRQGSMLMILCMGVVLVKISGGMDLSVGAVMTLSGMVMAWTLVNWNVPIPVAMLLCLAVGIICGLLNGVFVAKMNIPSFVATLGMQGMGIGLSLAMNKGCVIWGMPQGAGVVGNGVLLGVPIPIWISGMALVSSFVLLKSTPFGVYVYAIGGNEDALKLAGKISWRYKVLVYAYSGLLAGLAGIVITSRNMAAQPTVGLGMEFEAFSGVVLGGSFVAGRGTALGTVLGVLFILILRNGLNVMGIPTYYQLAIIGVVLISAIIMSILIDRRVHG